MLDIPITTCEKCNQPMYSISKRVYTLCNKLAGPAVGDIVKEHYGRRSKFLHRGTVRNRGSFAFEAAHVVPLLDANGDSGCILPRGPQYPLNLKEFTSHILRRLIEHYPSKIGLDEIIPIRWLDAAGMLPVTPPKAARVSPPPEGSDDEAEHYHVSRRNHSLHGARVHAPSFQNRSTRA